MGFHIRSFIDSDYYRVLEICLAAFTPIHEGFEDALGKIIFDYRYRKWREDYGDVLHAISEAEPTTKVYVAEVDGTVVGFVFTVLNPKYQIGEIGLNAVDPSHQGHGIGKRMYRFALNDLKERGAKIAYVGTGADAAHAPARAAYAAVGFDKSIPSIHYFKTL